MRKNPDVDITNTHIVFGENVAMGYDIYDDDDISYSSDKVVVTNYKTKCVYAVPIMDQQKDINRMTHLYGSIYRAKCGNKYKLFDLCTKTNLLEDDFVYLKMLKGTNIAVLGVNNSYEAGKEDGKIPCKLFNLDTRCFVSDETLNFISQLDDGIIVVEKDSKLRLFNAHTGKYLSDENKTFQYVKYVKTGVYLLSEDFKKYTILDMQAGTEIDVTEDMVQFIKTQTTKSVIPKVKLYREVPQDDLDLTHVKNSVYLVSLPDSENGRLVDMVTQTTVLPDTIYDVEKFNENVAKVELPDESYKLLDLNTFQYIDIPGVNSISEVDEIRDGTYLIYDENDSRYLVGLTDGDCGMKINMRLLI